MKATQKARHDALYRVQEFLGKHGDALGSVNQSKSRTALDDLVKTLAAYGADQHTAETVTLSRTVVKDDLREALRLHHMQPIAEIARAHLAGTPDITKLRLPPTRIDDGDLVSAGSAMAQAAAQYTQVFLDEQLPTDFVEQLRTAVDALRVSMTQRDSSRNDLRVATRAVDDQITKGRSIVRIMNGLVVKQLRGSKPELIAGWDQARRAKVKPGVPRGTLRTTQAPPAPGVPVQIVA